MKKISRKILILSLFAFVLNSGFAQVTADFDKSVDFNNYKTYSFGGWQDDSGKILNDIDKDRMRKAFQEEFAARNMKIVTENADAVVVLYLVINRETSTTAYTNYTGGMGYGARRGWGMGVGGVGMGSSTTTFSENDYQQGTLVVDIYDASDKKLIWQGTSQSTVQENPSKREKTIPKRVGKLMKKYPIEPVK
ncbi:MAG: DUF4136 domain-containing protein [Lutimonas sp.]